jgi:hypothetical protein
MKTIPLSKGHVALVSDEDYQRCISGRKWFALVTPRTVYALRHTTTPEGKDTTEYLHIFIMGQKGIDHIDHNGLNCQRENLRPATQTEQNANRRKTHGTSKYKGVGWNKAKKKWQATIMHKRKTINLGRFVSEVEAAKTYDQAARHIFGSFALTNFKGESN